MFQWFRDRLEILRLSFRQTRFLRVFGLLQIAFLLLKALSISSGSPSVQFLASIPWWLWALGWMMALWLTILDYSVERKKRFDETSLNFFRAYLDFILQSGHNLFHLSGEKDFYFKVKEWQHQAVLGIAIGLGPAESEKFFHKMEAKSPLEQAYKKSQSSGSQEALCRALQDHLDELADMRKGLPETEERAGDRSAALMARDRTVKGGIGPAPERKQLPPR